MARKQEDAPQEMTFFEHLDALRPHLVRSAVAVFVLMVAAFLAKGFIVDMLLLGPQSPDFPTNRLFDWFAELLNADFLRLNQKSFNIVNTVMAGQFNIHLKVSVITALVVATPYILWELWRFVRPALTDDELRGSNRFVVYVSLCFFTGLLFGYFVIAPLTINFFSHYTVSEAVVNMIDFGSYITTVLTVSVACAVVFELPLLIYFLARMGVVTSSFLRRYRKHAIVVLLVFAAVITPPDVFSQILVALPMYALYEYSIRLAARVERKRAEEETEWNEDEAEEGLEQA